MMLISGRVTPTKTPGRPGEGNGEEGPFHTVFFGPISGLKDLMQEFCRHVFFGNHQETKGFRAVFFGVGMSKHPTLIGPQMPGSFIGFSDFQVAGGPWLEGEA